MSRSKLIPLVVGLFPFFSGCWTNNEYTPAAVAPNPQVAASNCADPGNGSPFSKGDGSPENPFVICSATQLDAIGADSNLLTKSYLLGTDLDMSAYDASTSDLTFHSLGSYDYTALSGTPFSGIFDGAGHTISNLKVDHTGGSLSSGLFGFVRTAIIKNVAMTACNVSGLADTGCLVGYAQDSTVTNVNIAGTVNLNANLSTYWVNRIGGIVGLMDSSATGAGNIVTQAKSNVVVYSDDQGASVIGAVVQSGGAFKIDDCHGTGQVIGNPGPEAANTFGGLIGYLNVVNTAVSITNSSSTATVNNQGCFGGGFIGTIGLSNSQATITKSWSSGTFTTGSNPNVWCHGSFSGGFSGIVGVNAGSTLDIEDSASLGAVVSKGTSVSYDIGGFFGSLGVKSGTVTLKNVYSAGTVTLATKGNVSAGAFIGAISLDATSTMDMAFTYASGGVVAPAGSTNVGGFIGSLAGATIPVISASYWNSNANATGIGNKASLTGLSGETMAALQTQATFVGWDFTDVWALNPASFPQLR